MGEQTLKIMKGYFLLFIVAVLAIKGVYAQNTCNLGYEINITTQEQIDSIGSLNCISTETNFIITGPQITSLESLMGIKSVGYLTIENTSLVSLKGLDSLNSAYIFKIRNNDSLETISNLNSLRTAWDLWIDNNDKILSLEGLENLRTLDFGLGITRNNALLSVDGLGSLRLGTRPGRFGSSGPLTISHNPSLIDISAIAQVAPVGSFDNGVNQYSDFAFIHDNSSLSTCCVVLNHSLYRRGADWDEGLHIYNNAPGCNSRLDIHLGCDSFSESSDSCGSEGDLILLSRHENAEALSHCRVIYGNIKSSRALDYSGISGLEGLGNLREVHGSITMDEVFYDDLSELRNLQYVRDGFTIRDAEIPSGLCDLTNYLKNTCDNSFYWGGTHGKTRKQILEECHFSYTKDTIVCGFYQLNDSLITVSGEYPIYIEDSRDCDGLTSFNVTVNNPAEVMNISTCHDSIIAPSGKIIRQSGRYIDTLSTQGFCDDFIIINATFTGPVIKEINEETCMNSYTSPTGQIYNQTGVYRDTLINDMGCDTVYVIDLTLTGPIEKALQIETCKDTYVSPSGNTYIQSGTYYDTLQVENSCDTLYLIDIEFTGPESKTVYVETCESTYTSPKGKIYQYSGVYRDTLYSDESCDTIVITRIDFIDYIEKPLEVNTCFDSYIGPSGNLYTSSGVYLDTLLSDVSCDSVFTINLSLNYIDTIWEYPLVIGNEYLGDDGYVYSSDTVLYNYVIADEEQCDYILATDISFDTYLAEFENSRIAVPISIEPETGLTFEAWIRVPQRAGTNYIFDAEGESSGFSISSVSSGQLLLSINSDQFYLSSAYVGDGLFHLAITIDNQTGKVFIYKNGVLFLEETYNGTLEAFSGTAFIGGGSSDQEGQLSGQMHSVKIWDYAKSIGEIELNMCNGNVLEDDGLIAYWPLGEKSGDTVYDISGSSFNGQAVNLQRIQEDICMIYDQEGLNAVQLSGNHGGFSFTNYTGNYVTDENNEVTVEAWVRLDLETTNEQIVMHSSSFGNPSFSSSHTYMLGIGDNREVFFNLGESDKSRYTVSTNGLMNLDLNQWYHVAATYNPDSQKAIIYVDGLVRAHKIVYTPNMTINKYNFIGATNSRYPFQGAIKDVRVWDYARNIDQIQANLCSEIDPLSEGLVGYWPLNQGPGKSIVDLTRNTRFSLGEDLNWERSSTCMDGEIKDTIICNYYLLNDEIITESGRYSTQTEREDNVVAFNITFTQPAEFLEWTTCLDSMVAPSGRILREPGRYIDTLSIAESCDSVFIIDFDFEDPPVKNIEIETCESSYISPSGLVLDSTGIYSDTLFSNVACDTVYLIDLTFVDVYRDTVIVSTCDSIYTGPSGNTYRSSGVYPDTVSVEITCDSVYVLDITFLGPIFKILDVETCQSSYISPSGSLITSSGTYSDTLLFDSSCDTLYQINLTLNQLDTVWDPTIQAQSAYTWIDGNTYTENGIASILVEGENGTCDYIRAVEISFDYYIASFNNSRVSIPISIIPETGVTFEAWIKAPATTGINYIFDAETDSSGFSISSITHGQLRFSVNSQDYVINTGSTGNSMVHFAVTFDNESKEVKMYVDGRLSKSAILNTTINPFDGIAYLGAGSQELDASFYGEMHNVKIWSYPRSSEEIVYNMCNGEVSEEDGLIAHWPLNEKEPVFIRDIGRIGFHGEAEDLATIELRTCVLFNDYAADYNTLHFEGDHFGFKTKNILANQATTGVTAEAWVKLDSLRSGDQFVLFHGRENHYRGANQGYALGVNSEGYPFLWLNGGEYVLTSSKILDLNVWHHVAVTYDLNAEITSVFTDGLEMITGDYNRNFYNRSFSKSIGGSYNSEEGFQGNIKEVRIWNYALTQEELFNSQCETVSRDADGLIGYWQLNSKSGILINDLTGSHAYGPIFRQTWENDSICIDYNVVSTDDPLSINSLNNEVKLFPNPTDNIFNLTSDQTITNVQVNNMIGQVIFNQEFNDFHAQINMSHAPDGIYFVEVTTKTGNKVIEKLILTR